LIWLAQLLHGLTGAAAAAAAAAAVLSHQAHWEVFVGLFDETMTQLEKEIPQETREVHGGHCYGWRFEISIHRIICLMHGLRLQCCCQCYMTLCTSPTGHPPTLVMHLMCWRCCCCLQA
jgi:hypothetical protein